MVWIRIILRKRYKIIMEESGIRGTGFFTLGYLLAFAVLFYPLFLFPVLDSFSMRSNYVSDLPAN
jgi:hypothetical protein